MIIDADNIIVSVLSKNVKIKAIYYILNIINNKMYVGSTTNLYERFVSHKSKLELNKHDNRYLQKSYIKYGNENFKFGVLELLNDADNIELKEQYWIEELETTNKQLGYNLRTIAISNSGYKWSEASRSKLSNSKKGKPRSEETKLKLRMHNLGKKQSEETCLKRSLSMKGRKQTKEHVEKRMLRYKG